MKKLALLLLITTTLSLSARTFQGYVLPSNFHKAMISDPNDQEQYQELLQLTPQKQLLQHITKLYKSFVATINDLYNAQPRIPKIIHQIWIGPHPVPQETKNWSATWQALHPDWEYKLWTNEEVKCLKLVNRKYFDQAANWGEKADILRLELLYRYGGLYVDIDFDCFQPFDWLHHTCDFYTAMHSVPLLHKNKIRIANGIIGAIPKHPIIKHAIKQIPHYRHKKQVIKRTGPDFFTDVIEYCLARSKTMDTTTVILPANYFYPRGKKMHGAGHRLKPKTIFVQPETMAAHYYTSYWIPRSGNRYRRSLNGSELERKQKRKERLQKKRQKYIQGVLKKKRRIPKKG